MGALSRVRALSRLAHVSLLSGAPTGEESRSTSVEWAKDINYENALLGCKRNPIGDGNRVASRFAYKSDH